MKNKKVLYIIPAILVVLAAVYYLGSGATLKGDLTALAPRPSSTNGVTTTSTATTSTGLRSTTTTNSNTVATNAGTVSRQVSTTQNSTATSSGGVQIQPAIVGAAGQVSAGTAVVTTGQSSSQDPSASGQNSAGTTTVSGSTNQTSAADVQAPSNVARIVGTAVRPGSVVLSWSPSTDNVGVTGYTISYRIPSESMVYNQIKVAGNVLTKTISGLTVGSTYSFNVYANDAAGNSTDNMSNYVLVTVQ